MHSSDQFPLSFTVVISFYATSTMNRVPVFKVYDTTSGSDVELPVTLYSGTEKISKN